MWMFIISYAFLSTLTTTQSQSTGCIDASDMCSSTLKTDPNACNDGLFKTFCCKSCTPTTTTTTTTTTTPAPSPARRVNSLPGSTAAECPEKTSRMTVCMLGQQICSDELLKQLCCVTCVTKRTTTPSTTTSSASPQAATTKCRKRNAPDICTSLTLSDQNLCSDQLLGSVCCDSQSCSQAGLTSRRTSPSISSPPIAMTTASTTTKGTTTTAPTSRGVPFQRNLCLKHGKGFSKRCKAYEKAGLDVCRVASFCCEPCKGKKKDVICVDKTKKDCKGIKAPDCYEAAIQEHCCAKCKKFEKNIEGCMYGDRASNCKSLEKILGLNSMCQRRSRRCCETCQKLSGPSRNRQGNPRDRTRITRVFQTLPDGQGGTVFQRRLSGSFRDLFSALAGAFNIKMKMFIFLILTLSFLLSSVHPQKSVCNHGDPDPRCNHRGTNKIDGSRNLPDYYEQPTGKKWCKKRHPDIICYQSEINVCSDGKLRRLCCEVCKKTTDVQNTDYTRPTKRPDNWNICMICSRYTYFCLESDWKLFDCESFNLLKQIETLTTTKSPLESIRPQSSQKKTMSKSPKQCLKQDPPSACLQIDLALLCSVHYMKWTCCQNCV